MLVVLAAGAVVAEPPVWTVDPTASRLAFRGTQLSASFEGTFGSYTADIAFDPDGLAASRVRVVIDIASIDTGNAERDTAALGPEWFDSAKHPTAEFEVTGISTVGDGRYRAEATLTIRGTVRNVVFPFTLRLTEDGGRATARMAGELTISRGDFGIGRGQWAGDGVVGDAAVVLVEITATRP